MYLDSKIVYISGSSAFVVWIKPPFHARDHSKDLPSALMGAMFTSHFLPTRRKTNYFPGPFINMIVFATDKLRMAKQRQYHLGYKPHFVFSTHFSATTTPSSVSIYHRLTLPPSYLVSFEISSQSY